MWSGRPTLLNDSALANDNKKSSSPSRDLALASPPSPLQTAAGCAAPSPSRRVARSLLADGGRPSGFRPDRRRSVSRRNADLLLVGNDATDRLCVIEMAIGAHD